MGNSVLNYSNNQLPQRIQSCDGQRVKYIKKKGTINQ